MIIKQLKEETINKIAAGEVIERPVSVIKELVENALDASATTIACTIDQTGGKNYIEISDDGMGIGKGEIPIALKRHTTSKLNEDDLLDIHTFGFRGEALSSIATVSKLSLDTHHNNEAWKYDVANDEFFPSALSKGTTFKIEELFYKTPARLKFLKSDAQERSAIIDFIKRVALSHFDKSFTLNIEDKPLLNYPQTTSFEARVRQVLGEEFIKNSFTIDYKSADIQISGRASIPTYNFSNSTNFYVYINNRIVKDKLLIAAIRIAFKNLIPSGRFPMVVLFLDVNPKLVDVNVHPSKIEVRFQNENEIRELVINQLRKGFHGNANKTSTVLPQKAKEMLQWQAPEKPNLKIPLDNLGEYKASSDSPQPTFTPLKDSKQDIYETYTPEYIPSKAPIPNIEKKAITEEKVDLGVAKCQINNTYIIAENDNGLIIVDQHAAHERLVLEEIKTKIKNKGLAGQSLTIPEIIPLEEELVEQLMEAKDILKSLNFIIEKQGNNAINVRTIPQIFGGLDIATLLRDIAMNIEKYGAEIIDTEIEKIWGNIACHSSIRAGRKLRIEEMNAILRAIESTPNSGQCNHGRPTYFTMSYKDIHKLFERL